MMTEKQIKLAWRYVYRLVELDQSENKAEAGERMFGAIKKVLGVEEANVRYPFKKITKEQGEKLIENLKRYVLSAERKESKK